MVEYPSAQALMAGPLGGWLSDQVAVRAEAKRRASRRAVRAAVVVISLVLAILALLPASFESRLSLAGIVAAGAWFWSQRPIAEAAKAVKGGINGAIAQALGMTYTQDCDAGEEYATAAKFALVPHHDRSSFEDRWAGAVDNHAFSLIEAHLEERRSGSKGDHWDTVFRGTLIRIAFTQTFHGITLVTRQGRFETFFGGQQEAIQVDGQRLDIAPMVNPDFEDLFDVYTTDQTEARWIVHPTYIERLIGIERAFLGENIAAVFAGGAVTIALKSGDLFESGSIDPAEDRDRLEATIAQFQRLADLALELNSTTRRA